MTFESRAVQFHSGGKPSLLLEGRLEIPTGHAPLPAVVVAHPLPLWGGSMDAGVVLRIAQTLAERGIAALRFNFRGVGRSQGSFADGEGEIDDLIGALDWLATQSEVDAGQLAAVGYSFGAWVAGHAAARDERLRAYAAVALPMGEAHSIDLGHFNHPKCFIAGAQDTIGPPELLRQYVGALPEPKTLLVIPNADHFLVGYEQTVADHVADFLHSALTG